MLVSTTDKAPGLKKMFSAVARGAEKVIEKVGGESATLKSLGGHPETHILGETFYTQVPLLHGPYMAKISVVPISPGMLLLKDAPLDLHDKPDGLRDAVVDFFGSHSAEWELRVQLCTDIQAMPIDDDSAVSTAAVRPQRPVTRIQPPPPGPGHGRGQGRFRDVGQLQGQPQRPALPGTPVPGGAARLTQAACLRRRSTGGTFSS